MTSENLHKANDLHGKIKLIDDLQAEADQYRKERFTGSLPNSATRYLTDKPDLMLEVLDFIATKAAEAREGLQKQLNEI